MIQTQAQCPKCGEPVSVSASDGLCPKCLVLGVLGRKMLASPDDSAASGRAAQLPRRFGDYELLSEIARGGMGVIYRARHRRLQRIVALKMIRAAHLAGPAEVRRFLLEAEAAARLDHPNIVPIYEVGECDAQHYFTMKLVEGGSLAEQMSNESAHDSAAASATRHSARVLAKLARAVHYAHQRGVLHRDLKPANILLDANGEPLVTDFGLAKLVHGDSGLTLDGAVLGTPAYMAPESADGSTQYTTAGDVYSLGAIFYQMLAGRPPFAAENLTALLRKISDEEPVPPSECESNHQITLRTSPLSPDLETICLKCLEKNPARRYPDAAALADDLERWLRHEPILARQSSAWEKTAKWIRRKPALATLLAVCVVGAASFTFVILTNEKRLSHERNNAFVQERLARRAAQLAVAEARRASTNEFATRLNLYVSDVFLAQRALDDGNFGLARRALESHVPSAGQTGQRGFEWHYFWRRSQGEQVQTLLAHTQSVTCLAFSRDGQTLVSGGHDGVVRFWNRTNGSGFTAGLTLPPTRVMTRTEEDAMMAGIVAASPELLALLATGSDRPSGIALRSRPGNLRELSALALSADGRWLATGSVGSYVRVWNLTTLAVEFVVPLATVKEVAFTPDSQRLIVGESGPSENRGPGLVAIFDLASHSRTRTLTDTTGNFTLAPDGKILAVSSFQSGVLFLDLADGQTVRELPTADQVQSLAFSPDGQTLAGLTRQHREVRLWDTATLASRGQFSTDPGRIIAMYFSPDSGTLATAGADHAVRLWDAATQRERGRRSGHGDEVLALACSPTGDVIASAGKDLSVRLWRMEAERAGEAWPASWEPAFATDDGQHVAHRIEKDRAGWWRVADGRRVELPADAPREVLGLDPVKQTLTTLRREATNTWIEFWNTDGQLEGPPVELQGVAGNTRPSATAGAAKLCALAGARAGVALHDLRTGGKLLELDWGRTHLNRLLFSPDGQRLAGFNWPNRVRVWETTTGRVLSEWRSPDGKIQAMAFSPDGQLLATGGDDNRISLWNTGSGARVTVLRGHKAEIKALAFTPDGRTLASSSTDLTVKLWHTPTWRELGTVRRDGLFTFLEFAGDGRTLFAGEYRKAMRVLRSREEGVTGNTADAR